MSLYVVPTNIICLYCRRNDCEHIHEAIEREAAKTRHPASGE